MKSADYFCGNLAHRRTDNQHILLGGGKYVEA